MRRIPLGRATAATLGIFLAAALGPAAQGCNKVKCADGVIDPDEGETCDDGNEINGDGCNAQCQIEINCGDGLLDPAEECDDGNTVGFDGCSPVCVVEGGGVCGAGVPVRDANELGMMVTGPDRFIVVSSFETNRNDFTGQCGGELNDGAIGDDMVFQYVVPGSGPVTLGIGTQNGTGCVGGMGIPNEDIFDTLVYVRTSCEDPLSELACNDDLNTVFFNFCSYVEVAVTGGETIFIILDSLSNANYGDPFVLDINPV